jgi:protein-L-isoaspartate(D-aspartate) O-methyltransferase
MGLDAREAGWRNERLVEGLRASGSLVSPGIAAAFRSVPRHHFLPGLPLDEVYEDAAVMVKRSEDGALVSSSSQPAIMAIMLEQLAASLGDRVLEIGAGTGYNAGILDRIVGEAGTVVTVDIDEDLCEGARAHLRAARAERVEVARGDGALGWPPLAPYSGVIVTASVDDLAPAWLDQLHEGGRLVAPLAVLDGPVQLSVAFARRAGTLVSDSVTGCGFLPLRGEMARPLPARDASLDELLRAPARRFGATVPAADLRSGFEVWLAVVEPGYVRVRPERGEAETAGVRGEGGLALLEGGGHRLEVIVRGEGGPAARRLLAAHWAWARRRPPIQSLRLTAYPTPEAPAPGPGRRSIRRPNFTFLVTPPY